MKAQTLDTRQVRHHFSDHAGEYDLYARVQKRVAHRLVDLVSDKPVSGPVLDVGTGTGEVARHFLDEYPGQSIYVSDIAHDMTCAARRNIANSIAADGDARALPFAPESFGLVLSSSVFQWIEDLSSAFSECWRVLKPDGIFAFAMFCDGTLGELRQVFRQALDVCCSDWPFHFQSFPDMGEVASAMERTHFSDYRFQVEVETEYHDSFRDLMVGLKRIGAQNSACSRPRGLFPRRVMLEMRQLYDKDFRTSDGLPASYGVLYGFARKGD